MSTNRWILITITILAEILSIIYTTGLYNLILISIMIYLAYRAISENLDRIERRERNKKLNRW